MSRGAPVTPARFLRVVLGALGLCVLALAVGMAVGAEPLDLAALLAGGGDETGRAILFDLRLPRVLAAALVGAVLAVAGVAFQALLRNPLAEPYLLGISGGGAFGAVLAIVALGGAVTTLPGRVPAALGGCLVALAVVYLIASRRGALHPATLLLAGVVVNAFFLAALASVQYAASPEEAQAILRWVMGGFTTPGAGELVVLAVAAPAALVLVLVDARRLDLLAFGEETARGLGVDVEATRRRLFVVAAAATACSDAGARAVLAPSELPVGIVTATLGAPAFVVLLVRSRVRGEAVVA